MIGIAVTSAIALWWRGKLSRRGCKDESRGAMEALTRRLWIPLAIIPAAVLFLLLPISLPVWDLLPKLRFLQFPWRWLLVVEAPMGIFFAAAVWPGNARMRWLRPAI